MSRPQRPLLRAPTETEQALKKQWLHTLETDRARLFVTQPFTAALALQMPIVPVLDSHLPTAATDGRRLYFQLRFIEQLTPATRLFVLAHEVWHAVAGHLRRRQDRDPELWNLAVDHEVNVLLRQDQFELPRDAVLFPRRVGDSAEAVYAWLQGQADLKRDLCQFDLHSPGSGDLSPDQADTGIRDPDYSPQPADDALIQQWRQTAVGIANTLMGQGQLPLGLQQWLGALVRPEVPWQQLLRQFLQRCYGGQRRWLPPAQRYISRGLYLPSLRTERLRVTVAIDTSGSTLTYLTVFMSNLCALLRDFDEVALCLIECDAKIHGVRYMTQFDAQALARSDLRGGGGTDLRPPFEHVASAPPDCLVYLSDGVGPAPAQAPPYPVLWVLVGQNAKAPAPWGSVAYLRTPLETR